MRRCKCDPEREAEAVAGREAHEEAVGGHLAEPQGALARAPRRVQDGRADGRGHLLDLRRAPEHDLPHRHPGERRVGQRGGRQQQVRGAEGLGDRPGRPGGQP
eukprot:11267463-Alexandrium_andersonii.AAC.1